MSLGMPKPAHHGAIGVGWSLGEAWDHFLRGMAVFVFSWGRRPAARGRSRSKIREKCTSMPLPAS